MNRSEIELLLPEIFRLTLHDEANGLLGGLIDVMLTLLEPSEAILDSLAEYFDPYRAPQLFVHYLAGWVDLDPFWIQNPESFHDAARLPDFPSGLDNLRVLVARAAYLSQWRGTHKGMLTFLETATGVGGFRIDEIVQDESGAVIPFHIVVQVPPGAVQYRGLIERIVQLEKPAYVTAAITQQA
ncbi:MAG: hypothetical protein SF162_11690 [bacterium]|nr:hypothetical protein [bacterium]